MPSPNRFFAGSLGHDLIYSISGGKYNDPISNTVVIDDDDSVAFAQTILAAEFPQSLLRPFLHEATHHACSNSPVGMSLSALAAAAASDPSSFILGQNDFNDTVHDLVKGRALMEVFRPLLEGLAVFAEFDAAPGRSPVISEVLQRAFKVFLLSKWRKSGFQLTEMDPWKFTWVNLGLARASRPWIEAKKELLRTGFYEESGYLLGYLTIKSLRHSLIVNCPGLEDTDLFLSFMTSYLFGDLLLAKLLLDSEQEVGHIWGYFEDRLEYLFRNADQLVGE
ncbi:MAG: hypothetical protein ACRD8U_12680, partial [Pyrinomonadaceae bacterium]